MQAVRIHEHGSADVLRVDDVPRPAPQPGEVLVRVLAVSVNHLDVWVRRGMPGFKVGFPRVLGCDATGEVVACGAGVRHLVPGQKVVLEPGYSSGLSPEDLEGNDHLAPDYGIRGEHGDGFACEYACLPAHYLCPLPDGLDPVACAAVPLVFLTAWGMLVERARLQRGETVLVIGAASGVGSAGVQIARGLGARVIATGGSAAKRELALALGAEAALDHGDPQWPAELRKLTQGRGVDVVFEHVGPATWDASMRALGRRGRLVTCGGTSGPQVSIQLPHLFIKQQSVLGSTMGPRRALPVIFDGVARGLYRPVVDRALPLSQVARAHELIEAREVVGKLVLIPGQ